ncbi:MAG: TrkA family potassium uptake protein [Thermodesulfobacteriota bacterium]|nr:TrkA family potassium uptake protein [Thermodesulfobacteriota bacterium]
MGKQFAVIGLGSFCYYLAVHLYEKGHEVLAIDKKPKPVQEIKDKVSRAVVADATDRKALDALELKEMDATVVCIGSILSGSILTTLNLKDIGAKRVLAMALSEAHGRILDKVGASEVFFPEKDMAIFLGERIHNPNMLDYLPFVEGYSIIESAPPKRFAGKSLHELDLINQYGIQVVAIKERIPGKVHLIPTARSVIKENDILILLGPNDSLDKLLDIES